MGGSAGSGGARTPGRETGADPGTHVDPGPSSSLAWCGPGPGDPWVRDGASAAHGAVPPNGSHGGRCPVRQATGSRRVLGSRHPESPRRQAVTPDLGRRGQQGCRLHRRFRQRTNPSRSRRNHGDARRGRQGGPEGGALRPLGRLRLAWLREHGRGRQQRSALSAHEPRRRSRGVVDRLRRLHAPCRDAWSVQRHDRLRRAQPSDRRSGDH